MNDNEMSEAIRIDRLFAPIKISKEVDNSSTDINLTNSLATEAQRSDVALNKEKLTSLKGKN